MLGNIRPMDKVGGRGRVSRREGVEGGGARARTHPMMANFSWSSGASRSRPSFSARTTRRAARSGRRTPPSTADLAAGAMGRAGAQPQRRATAGARPAAEAVMRTEEQTTADIVARCGF